MHYMLEWPQMSAAVVPCELVRLVTTFLLKNNAVDINLNTTMVAVLVCCRECVTPQQEGWVVNQSRPPIAQLEVFILYFAHSLYSVENSRLSRHQHPSRFATNTYEPRPES